MDFLNALGLTGDCPTDRIATTLAESSMQVVTRIVAYPDAHLIADKLCRLERYCASLQRLEATPVGGSGFSLALAPRIISGGSRNTLCNPAWVAAARRL